MDEAQKSRLEELISIHNEFSMAIKLVENINFEIDYASLNDSRYALRALVDCIEALIAEEYNEDRFQNAFTTTRHALNVAWHDIIDIAQIEFKLFLVYLSKQYGADIVEDTLNMTANREMIYKIENFIIATREDRNARPEVYRQITTNDLKKLLGLYRDAASAEPAIASKRKKEKFRHFFIVLGGIASLLILGVVLYTNFIQQPKAQEPTQQPEQLGK